MEELLKVILDEVKTMNESLKTKTNIQKSTLNSYEASEYLGISYASIMRMIRAHKLPHVRLQGRVLFRIEALDEWMRVQEKESLYKQGIV